MHRLRLAAVAATALLLLAACGGDDDSDAASGADTRTIEVDMVDIAFEPDSLEVTEGEPVRIVFTNSGEVPHDAFIGNADEQAEHEAEMRKADGDDAHGGGHSDDADNAVTVEPGDRGELVYTFDEPGAIEIGCHQPGHYDAGMKITVEVT